MSRTTARGTEPQLNTIAFERIKREIITCTLEPGTQVTEAQLAARYSLGKAPIRAALRGLCHTGLLHAIPRRGYFIKPVTISDVQDIIQLRLLVEPTAARLAASRITGEQLKRLGALCQVRYTPGDASAAEATAAHREMHLLIARASGSPRLADFLEGLYDEVERLMHLCISRVIPEEMLGYRPLVEALAKGDAELAGRLMVEQIELGRKRVMDAVLSGPTHVGTDSRVLQSKKEFAIAEFAHEVDEILATTEVAQVPFQIARKLPRLLASPRLLTAEQRQSSPNSYRRHYLYEDAVGRFTIQALVWQPGQTTPVHDNPFWSVVGVYEGELRESCYRKLDGANGVAHLLPIGVTHHHRRDVTYMDPDTRSLHRFDNPTREVTISIHVFGSDKRSSGTINECYFLEDMPTAAT